MTKKLNVEAISNELHGASLYFQSPSERRESVSSAEITAPLPDQNNRNVILVAQEDSPPRTGERVNTRTPERMNRRSPEHPNARTPERVITRQSYNVYEDQHQALKRLEAMSALANRKPIPLSEMVREALDAYLQKHLKPEKQANA